MNEVLNEKLNAAIVASEDYHVLLWMNEANQIINRLTEEVSRLKTEVNRLSKRWWIV